MKVDEKQMAHYKSHCTKEKILELAAKNDTSVEETIFACVKDRVAENSRVALYDWREIADLSKKAITELIQVTDFEQVGMVVDSCIKYYTMNIINTMRTVEDQKRLAYYVTLLVREMLKIPSYVQYVADIEMDKDIPSSDSVLRGIVIQRICSTNVLLICHEYLRDELHRAHVYKHKMREKASIQIRNQLARDHAAALGIDLPPQAGAA